MEDIKTDQRTQMLVAGMVFFALVFPAYFYLAAGDIDDSYNIGGPVGNYSVTGTYSYHVLDSGSQYINDGDTADFSVNSDAISSEIDGKNIVGVRATMTFADDEQGNALCPGASVDDDVSGHLMHADLHNTQEVNSGDIVDILWHDSSLIDTTVSNMSESEIIAQLENNDDVGMGEHFLQISVDVNTADCIVGTRTDNGEEVSYTWELISLEYEIEAVE